MKFIALILSVLVLALSTVPCCALEPAYGHDKEQNSPKKDHHENDDDCCGHCSPFFTCGACPGFVPTAPISYPSAHFLCIPAEHHGLYLPSDLQELPSSIWQPPRIG